MADPLSVAASAAGLVSLGLTVTGGVAKYADAMKCRTDELASLKQRNQSLRTIIQFIDAVKSQLHTQLSHQQSPSSLAAVDESIKACKAELVKLESLMVELSGCRSTTSWRSKLKNTGKKLTYAFDRSKVDQLVSRLDYTTQALQLALDGLGLDSSRAQLERLGAIEVASHQTSTEATRIRSDLSSLQGDVHSIPRMVQDDLDRMERRLTTSINTTGHQNAFDLKTIQSEIASLQMPIQSIATEVNHGLQSIEGKFMTSIQDVQTAGLEGRVIIRQDIEEAFAGFESRVLARLKKHEALNDRLQLYHRLASKPVAFKELLDEVSEFQDIKPTPLVRGPQVRHLTASRSSSLCVCRYGRKVVQEETAFGLISIYSETDVRSHEPYCALIRARATKQRKSKSGIRFHGLVRLMNVVLDVSFNMTTGAGGRSISPMFTYYPTVDRSTDPAFHTIEQMFDDYRRHTSWKHHYCLSFWYTCTRTAMKKLEDLVLTGNANPRAVDIMNYSWIHFTIELADFKNVKEIDVFLTKLIELGVPPDSYDISGASPVARILMSYGCAHHDWFHEAHTVMGAQNELLPLFTHNGAPDIVLEECGVSPMILELSEKLCEAYECGPLTMAIIAGDASRVAHMINRWPNTIQEQNIIKQTPLHFAANKPQILPVLLPAVNPSTLNKQDSRGYTALDYAWMRGRSRHRKHPTNHVGDLSCNCLQCSDLILEVALKTPQYVLHPDMISRGFISVRNPFEEKALDNYLNYLRECCDHLRVETIHVLMGMGVEPSTMELTPLPGRYETELLATMEGFDDGYPSLINQWKVFRCLYTCVAREISTNIGMVEALFHKGFTQVDAFVDGGLPALATTWNYDYAQWLIDHGADPNLRLYTLPDSDGADTTSGVVSSHYAAFHLSRQLRWELLSEPRPDGRFPNYLQRLLSTDITDQCACACSDTGCTQFVYFLKGVVSEYSPRNGYDANRLIAWIGSQISNGYHLVAIRFLTFEELGMTHTCCNAWEFRYCRNPWKAFEGDIEGIQEEEGAMLHKLDLLAEEFGNDFRRIFPAEPVETPSTSTTMPTVDLGAHESDADSKSGGSRETLSSEAESEHEVVDPYRLFWIHHWARRMREVLNQMDAAKMSVEEKRATEEIGVVWNDST